MSEELKKSARLIRIRLKGIDLSDVKKMEEIERNPNLSSDARRFYKSYFEAILKAHIQQSLKNIAESAENEGQLMFGRGAVDLAIILDNWFKDQVRISLSKPEDKDESKTGEMIEPV